MGVRAAAIGLAVIDVILCDQQQHTTQSASKRKILFLWFLLQPITLCSNYKYEYNVIIIIFKDQSSPAENSILAKTVMCISFRWLVFFDLKMYLLLLYLVLIYFYLII